MATLPHTHTHTSRDGTTKDATIYEYPNSVYSQNVYLPNKMRAKQDAGDGRDGIWGNKWIGMGCKYISYLYGIMLAVTTKRA